MIRMKMFNELSYGSPGLTRFRELPSGWRYQARDNVKHVREFVGEPPSRAGTPRAA